MKTLGIFIILVLVTCLGCSTPVDTSPPQTANDPSTINTEQPSGNVGDFSPGEYKIILTGKAQSWYIDGGNNLAYTPNLFKPPFGGIFNFNADGTLGSITISRITCTHGALEPTDHKVLVNQEISIDSSSSIKCNRPDLQP